MSERVAINAVLMDALRGDFKFLYNALQKHPAILMGRMEKSSLERLYQSKTDEICSYDSLVNAATELTAFFEDGHTNIEVPYLNKDHCIPLPCEWSKDGRNLILGRAYGDIPAGARITGINGITVEQLVFLMAKRIPHENIYLVKSRMIGYPYQNYHFLSEMSLNYLFNVKDDYTFSFQVNDQKLQKRIPLQTYNGFLDFMDDSHFWNYEIQDHRMIFHLNACIYNQEYKAVLEKLARLCRERRLTSFVLDLSRNMGGSSAVIDEFIKYIDTDCFKRYEMTDYSSGEAKRVSSRQEVVKNERKSICFPADLYCRVSCHTFSSARTFAVTLRDNGLARIIGTQTGGKPNSFGLPVRREMPVSRVRFRVSTSYFRRPDERKDDADTLEIDEEQKLLPLNLQTIHSIIIE